jgi:hypothetical protein
MTKASPRVERPAAAQELLDPQLWASGEDASRLVLEIGSAGSNSAAADLRGRPLGRGPGYDPRAGGLMGEVKAAGGEVWFEGRPPALAALFRALARVERQTLTKFPMDRIRR